MANNGFKPSPFQVSLTSGSEPLGHRSPGSFATLLGGGSRDSAIGSSSITRVGYTNPRKDKTPALEAAEHSLVPRNNDNDNQQQGDMATPPATKRPRGRPRGSKNKPKAPTVQMQEKEYSITPAVIEIIQGSDVVKALIAFAHCRSVGISVLHGSGPVSGVMLRHPLDRAPPFSICGPLYMMSLSGTYYDDHIAPVPPSTPPSSSFSIQLSGSQGQILGGVVGGRLVAAGAVTVTAILFKKPEFHRVHFVVNEAEGGDNDDDNAVNANAGGTADSNGVIINNNAANGGSGISAYGAVGSTPLNNFQATPTGVDYVNDVKTGM